MLAKKGHHNFFSIERSKNKMRLIQDNTVRSAEMKCIFPDGKGILTNAVMK